MSYSMNLFKIVYKTFKEWRYTKRYEAAKTALRRMVKEKDKEIYGQIRGIAKIMAMKELDNARINHCRFCPIIAPLVSDPANRGSYLCHDDLKKQSEKQDAPIAVAAVA